MNPLNLFNKKSKKMEAKDNDEALISENEEVKNEAETENNQPENGNETEKELTQLREEVAQLKDKSMRLLAEFENYKKRTIKERIESSKMAGQEVFISLLPVLDDFDRAIKSINSASDVEALKEGVNLIYSKFKGIVETQGLKEMKSLGEAFDTDLHEAITSIEAPTEEQKGKVLDELEKGYYLNEKIIRYAKVVVGK